MPKELGLFFPRQCNSEEVSNHHFLEILGVTFADYLKIPMALKKSQTKQVTTNSNSSTSNSKHYLWHQVKTEREKDILSDIMF